MAQGFRERTVAFYELVALTGGEQQRIEQLDWPTVLAGLSRVKDIQDRTFQADDQTLLGQTYTWDETDHLLLHRVKSTDEWLSVVNWQTGTIEEVESAAGQGYLDTTAVCFLDYGNVMAIMQGSAAAPSHRSVERWANGMKFFGDSIVARPLVAKSEIDKMSTAEGVQRIEIKIGKSESAALAERGGSLASNIHRLRQDYGGDITVVLTISVPRGKENAPSRKKLLDDLNEIADLAPEATARAKAKLTYASPGGSEYSRLVELAEHHITAKRKVSAVDDEGRVCDTVVGDLPVPSDRWL